MNPQNVGQQIKMRHSSLWRKPLVYERRVKSSQTCHTQLNELGATGVSWKTRNNSITTHSRFGKFSLVRKTNSKQLQQILKEQDKQSNLARSMIHSLRADADIIDNSQELLKGMKALKRMNLLIGKDLQKIKFPGVIKYNHIYNDYHQRIVNPGFSRNHQGKFYTK